MIDEWHQKKHQQRRSDWVMFFMIVHRSSFIVHTIRRSAISLVVRRSFRIANRLIPHRIHFPLPFRLRPSINDQRSLTTIIDNNQRSTIKEYLIANTRWSMIFHRLPSSILLLRLDRRHLFPPQSSIVNRQSSTVDCRCAIGDVITEKTVTTNKSEEMVMTDDRR